MKGVNFVKILHYYEYNNKNAIINENNPVASAKANPRIANENNCPLIDGFLDVEAINEEKIKPIPAPAPINPEQAKPAPIYFAAANIANIAKYMIVSNTCNN
jgi:hypothetical protein